jgi:hypothetical protein
MRFAVGSLARGGVFVALAACPILIHVALSTSTRTGTPSAARIAEPVSFSLVAASAALHASIYVPLLVIFGVTLLPGRAPLITALARKMYGDIPAEMVTYTRGVTWAWCCFFAAQLCTSLILILWAPIVAWSLFVNVLDLPLVALMFAGEQVFRIVRLHNPPRHTVSDVMRMIGYIKDSVSKQGGPS